MSETARMWFEIILTLSYLAVLWVLVALMFRHLPALGDAQKPQARTALAAFVLLALGDTPHIVARVTAYALGGLDARPVLFGQPLGIVGLGALATSVTLTGFYVLLLRLWRQRFDRPYGWFGYVLLGAALVRLIIMLFPANDWQSATSPPDWALYRNVPFLLLGLGTAYLFIRDGRAAQDHFAIRLGGLILLSYAFYTPVFLLAHRVPALGMLMLPKTLAYGIVAWEAYRHLYRRAA
ncbi:MAG: hypothetical protein JXD18_07425 [Anaerolineae bacterium]|nr:hypothetical protein [Anaerolineae bacterium]